MDSKNEEPIDAVLGFGWTGTPSAPAEMMFYNNTLYATSYKWDFGNGQTSTKQIPDKVTYTQAGSYDIILTANNGKKNFLLKRTLVIAPNTDPIAHFSYQFKDQRSFAPATVLLNNESVNATSWEWDINGVIHRSEVPFTVFNNPGDYLIKLTAINGAKRSAVFQQTVTVAENSNPIARFAIAYRPIPYTVGEEVQFVNRSVNSDSYEWTFGTNGPAATSQEHPSVKFSAAGMYKINLVSKKGLLISAPYAITIRIDPAP